MVDRSKSAILLTGLFLGSLAFSAGAVNLAQAQNPPAPAQAAPSPGQAASAPVTPAQTARPQAGTPIQSTAQAATPAQSTPAQAAPAQAGTQPSATTNTTHHRPQKKKDPPPLVLPPLPAGPLSQVPMDQIPENPPKVTYEKGLLTIFAENATLGEILKQVRKLTKATIDLPPNGAPERVVTAIGPGAPRDVLAALLNGTQFNYVILGSTADPTIVASVILTPKPGGSEMQNAAAGYQQASTSPGRPGQPFRTQMVANNPPPQPEATAEDESADDAENNTDDAAADQQPPAAQPGANQTPGDQGANPNQPNAGPRTPEQLLQMMRQGQQPGTPPPPQQ
jgi:hypothetical protein